jgi:hypothetical protein
LHDGDVFAGKKMLHVEDDDKVAAQTADAANVFRLPSDPHVWRGFQPVDFELGHLKHLVGKQADNKLPAFDIDF